MKKIYSERSLLLLKCSKFGKFICPVISMVATMTFNMAPFDFQFRQDTFHTFQFIAVLDRLSVGCLPTILFPFRHPSEEAIINIFGIRNDLQLSDMFIFGNFSSFCNSFNFSNVVCSSTCWLADIQRMTIFPKDTNASFGIQGSVFKARSIDIYLNIA